MINYFFIWFGVVIILEVKRENIMKTLFMGVFLLVLLTLEVTSPCGDFIKITKATTDEEFKKVDEQTIKAFRDEAGKLQCEVAKGV